MCKQERKKKREHLAYMDFLQLTRVNINIFRRRLPARRAINAAIMNKSALPRSKRVR